jgi:hypothetical protein
MTPKNREVDRGDALSPSPLETGTRRSSRACSTVGSSWSSRPITSGERIASARTVGTMYQSPAARPASRAFADALNGFSMIPRARFALAPPLVEHATAWTSSHDGVRCTGGSRGVTAFGRGGLLLASYLRIEEWEPEAAGQTSDRKRAITRPRPLHRSTAELRTRTSRDGKRKARRSGPSLIVGRRRRLRSRVSRCPPAGSSCRP